MNRFLDIAERVAVQLQRVKVRFVDGPDQKIIYGEAEVAIRRQPSGLEYFRYRGMTLEVDGYDRERDIYLVFLQEDDVRKLGFRVAARTKYKKVEPTTPGSKNHFKITYYDGQEKWVDARPGTGQPSRREKRLQKIKLNKPSSQRGLNRLDKALKTWHKDGEPEVLQQAVEKNEVGLDKEFAKEVSRLFVKKVKKQEPDDKTEKGLQVIKDHVNRHRRDSSERMARIAESIITIDFSNSGC